MELRAAARALRLGSGIALTLAVAACAHRRAPAAHADALSGIVLADADGRPVALRDAIGGAPATVVEFFSAHCPCQRAHDERLAALHAEYAPRGVRFVAIDAEAGASPERAAAESRARRYPFPLYADAKGASADALGAEFATYTIVLDRDGVVRYRGGIDSDRSHLTADADVYVKDALDDVLAGRAPRTPAGKVLGCALER